MNLSKKILEKHAKALSAAEGSLRKVTSKIESITHDYNTARRIIGRIQGLKTMSDWEIRKMNLPRILAIDCSRDLLEFYSSPGDILHYEISEKLDAFREYLVKRHDAIYHVENQGEMGSMSARHLKDNHDPSEFDDGVWDVIEQWKKAYCNRQMNQETYESIMNDTPDSLYKKLAGDTDV